ncbi:MAG: SapC family protein [Arcobacter sp.]|nr:SapC family protein [Arcobacter sp.]
MEFIAFSGISPAVTIFNKEGQYIPFYARTYPFLNAVLIDKNGKRQDVIGVDNSEYLGKKKANNIFKKDGELDTLASAKIKQIHELNRQRDISKKIIKEFIKYDLLIKKDFKVNYGEDSKVILDNFYIVNREKLIKLDDDILALWAKKGWITLIDMHIKSLNNFEKVVFSHNQ